MGNYDIIEKALKYIENHQEANLDEVAEHVHISPFHFQRVFKEWAGVTPKQFIQFLSIERAKSILDEKNNLTETTYKAGLSSPSRLHDLFVTIEAMTPAEYKDKGKDLEIKFSYNDSPFGHYMIATTSRGICNLAFVKSQSAGLVDLKSKWFNAKLIEGSDENQQIVHDYLNKGILNNKKIKLHLKGTNFQLKVWEALLKIPQSKLSSYSRISEIIGSKAHRAVGTAISNNPVAFIIPCHRVVKNIGKIGNYRWGTERKMGMIGWEAAKLMQE